MTSPPLTEGTVYGMEGGVYQVRLPSGEMVEAVLRGRLKQDKKTGDKVVIGDVVRLALHEGSWAMESVAQRRSQLVRRGVGGRRVKVVAANVERVLVVIAARDPDPSLPLLDRLLVVSEASGIHPVLVVNKVDLPGGRALTEELAALYEPIGYPVLAVSAATGEGMELITERLRHGTSALVGPSGAGKSSILNALHPELELRTGVLSRKTGRGRHTTVSSRLIPLECGGTVADTPGFGDVGLWGLEAEEVAGCFPEFAPRVEECRFRGCAHLKEPDCAVRAAVEDGRIAESRYRSYVVLREEAAEAAEAR